MSDLKRLRARAAELRQALDEKNRTRSAIGTAAVAAKRSLTDDERARFLGLGTEIDALTGQLAENAPLLAAAESANEKIRNFQGDAASDPDEQAAQQAAARAGIVVGPSTFSGVGTTARRGRRYADLFPAAAGQLDGFANTEDFLRTLHSGRADARLVPASMRASSTASESDPSSGGFIVPPATFAGIFDSALESQVVLPRCDLRPMAVSELKLPAWDSANHNTDGLFGGFAGSWLSEGAAASSEMGKLRLIQLRARKLLLFCQSSNELIADGGVSFEAELTRAISAALAFFLDAAFLSGDGSNKPLGVLSSPATIKVARSGANHIVYGDVVNMFSRLHPASFAGATWVASQSALPDLLVLSQAIGTAGVQIPILREANGGYSLLGRPLIISEKLPTLGSMGDLLLADFMQYTVGMRSSFVLEKSVHVGFQSDVSVYRGTIRVDGQPKLAAPIVPLNGGDTLSPFVALDAA